MDRRNEWEDFFAEEPVSQNISYIPLDALVPWTAPDGSPQPFKPYSKKKLEELAANIRDNGVLSSIRVRPIGDGVYQIIAGHNRVEASKLAGLVTIPAIVTAMDDDAAAKAMVDSNLKQREKILPSEKAYAYKIRMDAARHQGQRTDLTSTHSVSKLRSDETVAAETGESRETIRRYICLTRLIPELLDRVDEGKLGFTPAVELSYLPKEVQTQLSQILADSKSRVSKGAACQLRAEANELTPERIRVILGLDGSEAVKKPLLKLDLSGFDSGQLARLQADAGLEAWLLEQIKQRLSQGGEA